MKGNEEGKRKEKGQEVRKKGQEERDKGQEEREKGQEGMEKWEGKGEGGKVGKGKG